MEGTEVTMIDFNGGKTERKPTWQCEFCGKFYSERTAKDHAYCVQAGDRRDAEKMWPA